MKIRYIFFAAIELLFFTLLLSGDFSALIPLIILPNVLYIIHKVERTPASNRNQELTRSEKINVFSTEALAPVLSGAFYYFCWKEKFPKKARQSLKYAFIIPVVFIIVASTLFFVTYIFLFRPFQIAGQSMAPNYVDGQYYMARIIGYNAPQRGDVVVFHAPTDPDKDFDKRIIGIPGDKISLKNGDVYLSNNKLNESGYLKNDVKTYGGNFLKEEQNITVPQGQYFVMGDNRPFSSDSREYGFVPKEKIIGKMEFCYYKCR